MISEIKTTGVGLFTEGDRIMVSLELDGEWVTVINEYCPLEGMTISSIVAIPTENLQDHTSR